VKNETKLTTARDTFKKSKEKSRQMMKALVEKLAEFERDKIEDLK
jgi:hypothetical protein